jgi:hypothetical protein
MFTKWKGNSPANHRLRIPPAAHSHLLAVGSGVLPLGVYLHVQDISANREVEGQLFMLMGSIACEVIRKLRLGP